MEKGAVRLCALVLVPVHSHCCVETVAYVMT